MKPFIYSLVFLAALTGNCSGQEDGDSDDEGIYGYSSLEVVSSTELTAYSETDLDPSLSDYYSARVVAQLKDSNGHVVAGASTPTNDDSDTAYVTFNYTSATPNATYTLTGIHQGILSITDPCGGCQYVDYYDYFYYSSLNIDAADEYEYEPAGSPRSAPETINLGQTFETVSATTPGACNDERDTIITEYKSYKVGYSPTCETFTQSVTTIHFTFPELNSGTYSWAILRSYFQSGIETVRTDNGNVSLTVTSGYRNPAKQAEVNQNVVNSRHVYGDAVDFASNNTTWQGLHDAGKKAGGCVEPIIAQGNSYAHCHIDFRGGCPSKW